MDLFGINPEGGISLSSGAVPTPRQVDQIMKACAQMVGQFAYQDTIKKGLIVPETHTAPTKEPPTLKERKDAFYQRIVKFKSEHPDKYPFGLYENFFSYWTEPGASKKKGKGPADIMRFEAQDFFDIGRRLATSWGIFDSARQSEMWKRHKEKFPSQPTLL